jgi:hypothetical protein
MEWQTAQFHPLVDRVRRDVDVEYVVESQCERHVRTVDRGLVGRRA